MTNTAKNADSATDTVMPDAFEKAITEAEQTQFDTDLAAICTFRPVVIEGGKATPEKCNDAILLGRNCPQFEKLLDRTVTFFTGKHGKYKKWPVQSATWRQWIEGGVAGGFSRHRTSKKKASLAVVMASFTGTARMGDAVTHMHALALDFDAGTKRADVEAKLKKLGIAAIVYTSHSDQKTASNIAHASLERVFKDRAPTTLTKEDVRTYLADHAPDYFTDEHIESAQIIDYNLATDDGYVIRYTHAPMDKFRVVFPLAESVDVKMLGRDLNKRKAVWADKVTGAARVWLDGHFDVACTDMTRVFYMPEHAPGADYYLAVYQGRPATFEEIPSASKRDYIKEYRTPVPLDGEVHGDPKLPSGERAKVWAASDENARRLRIGEMLYIEAPDRVRQDKGNGLYVVECPFEHFHGSPGGTGTHVKDGEGEGDTGFRFACKHNSCAGHSNLDLLCEALKTWPELDENHIWMDQTEGGYLWELADEEDGCKTSPGSPSVDGASWNNRKNDPMPKRNKRSEGGGVPSGDNDADQTAPAVSMNIADPLGSKLKEALATLEARWAVVNVGGKVLFMPRPDLDSAGGVQFFTETEFKKFHANRTVGKGGKKQKPAKIFAANAKRYSEVAFAPAPVVVNRNAFNLWQGYQIDQTAPNGATCAKLKAFIFDVVCGGRAEVFQWVWLWLAHATQQPGQKPGTALVIQGNGGCGKSYFGTVLTRLFSPYTVFADRAEHVTGQFNRHLATAMLLVSDEALFGGDGRVSGLIKSLVTTNVQRIEAKGVDSIEVPSFLRCVFIGNPKRVIPIEANGSDRRYMCLAIADTHKDDTAYFGTIESEIENGGLEALFAELKAYDPKENGMEWHMVRKAPETAEKKAMRRLSLPNVLRKMIDGIEDGALDLREGSGRVVRYELAEDTPTPISRDHMRAGVARWADSRDGGQDAREVLADLFGDAVGYKRTTAIYQRQEHDGSWEDDTRPRAHCYVLPPCRDMLAAIEDKFEQTMN